MGQLASQIQARRERLQRFAEAASRHERRLIAPTPALPIVPSSVSVRLAYETKASGPNYMPIASRILRAVAREFDLTPETLISAERQKYKCEARFVAIGLIFEMTQMSLPAIGRRLGGRDHTTILHGARRAKAMFAEESFRNRVDQIKAEIGA